MSFGMLSDVSATLHGSFSGADRAYSGVSTDSRQLAPNQLFVALRGPSFDGHEFVAAAATSGAAGAVVETLQDSDVAQIAVDDTRLALGDLARAWRRAMDIPVIAVTGSNGKTTVKQMLFAIFATARTNAGAIHATRGNLNNDIGLPLTLLDLNDHHRIAIVEMGANHPGEIAHLTAVAQPDIALVTNAAAAHLEGFGSIDGVAHAKAEIFAGLSEDGVAIINADDAYASLWIETAGKRRVVRFGVDNEAEIGADAIVSTADHVDFRLCTPDGDVDVHLPVPGPHNVMNALAATAAAWVQGLSPVVIADGLRSTEPVDGRMRRYPGRSGSHLVDDSYNANPYSFAAAIDYLAGLPGSTWLVMGDMAELGDDAPHQHACVGRLAKDRGVTRLYCTGDLAQMAADAFGDQAVFEPDVDILVSTLMSDIDSAGSAADITLLIKASRSMRLERVVDALRDNGLQRESMGG